MKRFLDPPDEQEHPCEYCYYDPEGEGCMLNVPLLDGDEYERNLDWCPLYGVVKKCQHKGCQNKIYRFKVDIPEENIAFGYEYVYCCSKKCADEEKKDFELYTNEI